MNDESARIEALGEALYVKPDGRTEDGGYIKGLSEEGDRLRLQAMAQDGVPISNESYTQVMQGGDTIIIGPSESRPGFNFFDNTASD